MRGLLIRLSALKGLLTFLFVWLGTLKMRGFTAVGLLFLANVELQAAFSNYNSILIGEQSAGLGGAYTALYGDAAGAPFYNPAGLAWMSGNSFSSSVSIYKKFDTIMGKEEDLIKAPLRVNQGFFQSIPSSAGSVMRVKDYNVGLSIVVPDYDTFKGDISTTAKNTSTLSFLDESLWVGITTAKKISEKETMGITLYYTARNYNRTVQDRTVDETTKDALLFSEEKSITSNILVAVLGYQIHWTPDFYMGASLRTPGYEVAGSGSYFRSEISATAGALNPPTAISRPSISASTKIPGKFSLGFAYRYEDWLLSVDGSIYSPERYYDLSDPEIRSKVEHAMMFNGAIGVQYSYQDWLILRTGWFTNLTSHKRLDILDKYGDRVDQLGWSANFTFISQEKIRFTFGGYYNLGRGNSIQRINQNYEIIPKTQQVFTMLAGTSYYF